MGMIALDEFKRDVQAEFDRRGWPVSVENLDEDELEDLWTWCEYKRSITEGVAGWLLEGLGSGLIVWVTQ
jgi:hypothetical protein